MRCLNLYMRYLYHTSIKAWGISLEKGREKILRVRGDGWLQGSSVLQTRQADDTHMTCKETLVACPRLVQAQDRWCPSMKEEKLYKVPPLDKMLLIATGRGKIRFCQWSDTVYINHTPQQVTCSELVSQHKTNSMVFLGAIKNIKLLGRESAEKSGRRWGKGNNVNKNII